MKSCLALTLAFSLRTAAFAAPITYTSNLSGRNESPANISPGIGTGTVIIDTTAHTLFVSLTFSGLVGLTSELEIHCCTVAPLTRTAGAAARYRGDVGFPQSVRSGSFTHTIDLTRSI